MSTTRTWGTATALLVSLVVAATLAGPAAMAQQLAPSGGLFADWSQPAAAPDPVVVSPAEQARLAQIAAVEQARMAALETPALAAARVDTRTGFDGLTRADARLADLAQFPQVFGSPAWTSPLAQRDVRMLGFVGSSAAVIEDRATGASSIVSSSVPLLSLEAAVPAVVSRRVPQQQRL